MLDEFQKEAVEFKDGACLTLAGPGSGKTHTLLHRTLYLIEKYGVSPGRILLITFTKDSALEMQRRITSYGAVYPVVVGTFHSVFFKFLRKYYHLSNDSLLFGKEKAAFFRKAVKEKDEEVLSSLEREISFYMNTGGDIDSYEPGNVPKEKFLSAYKGYTDAKKAAKKIDFDDMLFKTRELFLKSPEALRSVRSLFSYIMVDEAQDMNPVQYEILKLMAGEKGNVFLVGDDDQSVYSFRGASPDILFKFMEDYPEAKTIVLSKNYRCGQSIVEGAARLISHNKKRYVKNLVSAGEEKGEVYYLNEDNETEEAMKAVEIIKNGKGSTAVLFRNHLSVTELLYFLEEEDIPYEMKEGMKSPFSHFVCRDILSYLKKPEYKKISPYAAITYILKGAGYEDSLRTMAKGDETRFHNLMAHAEELREFSRGQKNVEVFLKKVEYIKESSRNMAVVNKVRPKVFLYTFHGSKGLEFDNVIILDANQGITPSSKAETEEKIEEERRMFYVAATRAKKKLYIFSIGRRNNANMYPSCFVREFLPE
ncbi:MAG: ATP-dependent helicase [Lachnospiraceae bacterium]|nr:ATP-dependent helicase [Lachnospiraceae bacterium]